MNRLAILYVKRVPQLRIAEEMGVSQGQISQDLKKLLKKWEAEQIHQIDRYKHEELARINAIEEEMWTEWELSKTKGKKSIFKGTYGKVEKKKIPGTADSFLKDPTEWKEEQKEDSAVGNVEFIRVIQWCVEKRCKILGLDAPKKVANTNPEGTQEAGEEARRELLGMIKDVADKLNPSKNPTEKIIDVEGRHIDALELASKIREDRIQRLPPVTIPSKTV